MHACVLTQQDLEHPAGTASAALLSSRLCAAEGKAGGGDGKLRSPINEARTGSRTGQASSATGHSL